MTTNTRRAAARAVEDVLRCGILATFVLGVRRRDLSAVANAVVAFAASFIPDAIEALSDVEFRPWQRVYVGTALLNHAVGMLGPYDDVWWWDHLTHTHTATVLGGVVHVAARRRGRDPRPSVLGAVCVGGLLWELLEYVIHAVARRIGVEPLLVHYGRRDTLFDLAFNLLGALLVLAFGDSLLRNAIRRDE